MSKANSLTADLLCEIPKRFDGARVARQNTGGGVGMSTIRQAIGLIKSGQYAKSIQLLSSRPIKWGVVGGGDIVGWLPIEMAGKRIARFMEIEVKAEGDTQSEDQKNRQKTVTEMGGVYVVCRSVEQTIKDLEAYV